MNLLRSRFRKKLNKDALDFTSSFAFDKKLCKYDIAGSIAHAKMLGKCGIIAKKESGKIIKCLARICREIDTGKLKFSETSEDIHMAVEQMLIRKIGETGKKLHTARSRNDQVALDLRMFLRDAAADIKLLLKVLQEVIIKTAQKNIGAVMPGYTHLQHAQPVLFSHHIMAYFWMLDRDAGRLSDCLKRINVMPLGSGPLAGTSFPIDRKYTAKLLGFSEVSQNSIDAVSDRDFAIETLGCLSIIMVHLSRFSEELVLWSSPEFGFVDIDESFCTGSSIMPQKKNPDVAELVRGKTGRVIGSLNSLLVTMKGLPLSYNSDMQEDKEAVFDAVTTVKKCLRIYSCLLENITINRKKMLQSADDGFSTATDLADYLVREGLPFREAYSVACKIVNSCLENGKRLDELTLKELKAFSQKFSGDVYRNLKPENAVGSRKSSGGTAKVRVLEQIRLARRKLKVKIITDNFLYY